MRAKRAKALRRLCKQAVQHLGLSMDKEYKEHPVKIVVYDMGPNGKREEVRTTRLLTSWHAAYRKAKKEL